MASVPGAHILTNVAPEDVAADLGPEQLGGGPFELNAEVGNTTRRVHHVGFNQRFRGARLEARRARPAAVGSGQVRREIEVGQENPQEKP